MKRSPVHSVIIAWMAMGSWLLGGVGCSQMTTLEFREPAGSHFDLEGGWDVSTRRVLFPSRRDLEQFARVGSDENRRPLTGEIRIDRSIDLERIPPGSERYILKQGNIVKIRVKGYYWVYRCDQSLEDELKVHYVDVRDRDIYALLEGNSVTLESSGARPESLHKFVLGIVFPTAAQASEETAGQEKEK